MRLLSLVLMGLLILMICLFLAAAWRVGYDRGRQDMGQEREAAISQLLGPAQAFRSTQVRP